jgi:hypothetical protein
MANDQTMHVSPATVRISPLGFLLYAKDFLQAEASFVDPGRYSPVPYFLICQSIELALKAFLLARGREVADVKNEIRHDLGLALEKAKEAGLGGTVGISTEVEAAVSRATVYYKDGKRFQYFRVVDAVRAYPDLPNLAVLREFAQVLAERLEPICLAAA